MLGKITVSWIFHHLFFLTLIKLAEVQMELSERHSCVKCTHFRADVQSEAKRRKQISYFAYAMAKNKNREGVHTPLLQNTFPAFSTACFAWDSDFQGQGSDLKKNISYLTVTSV